ncbi:hypothetical protein FS749_014666 [Ceratobasidium sp. UAMH 11750]|nr:hypothetical protein FS749_014666 [Ceratobasidium sp. UAMH 11750]
MSTYPLIPTPPGDWKNNLYELHAIRMAALHNTFIRTLNSIIYHAPNITSEEVPSFMKYCNSLVAMMHEHHATEEEVVFPVFEEKLGKGAMDANVTQHQDFMPKFDEWAEHCKNILAKKAEFKPAEFTKLMRESTDVLAVHLVDEIPTMEASRLRPHFTEAELQALEVKIVKKVQELVSPWDLPLMLVNGDASYNSWFPEIPGPVIFVARHILMRLSGDMWKYGQSDKYMKSKEEYRSVYGL